MMSPFIFRVLTSAIGAIVVSAFGTPVFHAIVTKQTHMTNHEDLVWFGSSFAVMFIVIWLLLGRQR